MKKWKSIKIEEELMKELEPMIENKSYKSKSEFLKLAVEEKLKSIRDERMKDRLKELEEFFDKNAVTLRRKGINNMSDLTSMTLSNTEDIKRLEERIEDYEQTTREMIATVDQDQLKILTHKEMKQILKEIGEVEDRQ